MTVWYRTTQGAMVMVENARFNDDRDGDIHIVSTEDGDIHIVSTEDGDDLASIDRDKIEWITTIEQVAAGFGWVKRVDDPDAKPRDNDSPVSREQGMSATEVMERKRDDMIAIEMWMRNMFSGKARLASWRPTAGCLCPACTAHFKNISAVNR